jgi:hypothetical protein
VNTAYSDRLAGQREGKYVSFNFSKNKTAAQEEIRFIFTLVTEKQFNNVGYGFCVFYKIREC